MSATSQYEQLGVDPAKAEVREIFRRIVRNDFPGAFVNIARCPGRVGMVMTMHTDGDGSKGVQRLLHFRETGDATILQGAVDDAIAMNTGDIAASGFVSGLWALTQTVNVNGLNVPKDQILEQLALRVESLLWLYREHGFNQICFLGGETADLPHQVGSVVYDIDVYAEALESLLVTGNVKPGDKIYGFASDGQADWETQPNSGIMSNGLTLARACLMSAAYGDKYRYLRGDQNPYRGRFQVTDTPDILGGLTVSQALLSPTRQWAIVIRRLIAQLYEQGRLKMLHGISMNTGGGATKVRHVGGGGIIYDKTMPKPPPIFQLIQQEAGETWRNMYQTFNCGMGIDVVGEDAAEFKQALREVERKTGIKLYELGACQPGEAGRPNKVVLHTPYGDFSDY